MTFWAGLGGSLGSAIGGAIGGSFGSSGKSRKYHIEGQAAARRRLWEDVQSVSRNYGIHPLIALGSTPHVPTGGFGTGSQGTSANIGAELGSAIGQYYGGKGERRAAKLRQLKLDAMNAEKHKAEIAAIRARANRDNAVADQAISSVVGRAIQKSNQTNYGPPVKEPMRESGLDTPHEVPLTDQSKWTMGAGVAGDVLEQQYGEAALPLQIHKFLKDLNYNYWKQYGVDRYGKSKKFKSRPTLGPLSIPRRSKTYRKSPSKYRYKRNKQY
jgi:hypothetical protein